MRLQIGAYIADLIENLVGEAFERVVHAFRRLAGCGEELDAGAIGLFLLGAQITDHRILDRRGRPGDGGGAGLAQILAAAAAGGNHRADAEEHRDDGLRRRRGQCLAHARQMSAGDVPGFVGEHADDLIRRLRLHQRAAVDEDAVAVGDEGVERTVVDDDDLNILLRETGRAQDRLLSLIHI